MVCRAGSLSPPRRGHRPRPTARAGMGAATRNKSASRPLKTNEAAKFGAGQRGGGPSAVSAGAPPAPSSRRGRRPEARRAAGSRRSRPWSSRRERFRAYESERKLRAKPSSAACRSPATEPRPAAARRRQAPYLATTPAQKARRRLSASQVLENMESRATERRNMPGVALFSAGKPRQRLSGGVDIALAGGGRGRDARASAESLVAWPLRPPSPCGNLSRRKPVCNA